MTSRVSLSGDEPRLGFQHIKLGFQAWEMASNQV